jgi:hypothetical protein
VEALETEGEEETNVGNSSGLVVDVSNLLGGGGVKREDLGSERSRHGLETRGSYEQTINS